MNALESIYAKLAPMGLYSDDENSNVYKELSAYAAALDVLRENIETALRECFISTSESFGIERREKVFGRIRSDYSAAERREMLRLRNIIGESDYTLDGLGRILESLGVTDYNITEMPNYQTVSVCIGGSYNPSDRAWILNELPKFLPAHLNYDVYFGGKTWQQLDAHIGPYNEFDANDYTWRELNNL